MITWATILWALLFAAAGAMVGAGAVMQTYRRKWLELDDQRRQLDYRETRIEWRALQPLEPSPVGPDGLIPDDAPLAIQWGTRAEHQRRLEDQATGRHAVGIAPGTDAQRNAYASAVVATEGVVTTAELDRVVADWTREQAWAERFGAEGIGWLAATGQLPHLTPDQFEEIST